jgi:hypothetical protein
MDLANGPPTVFSDTQLTRVMRNLESLIFSQVRACARACLRVIE